MLSDKTGIFDTYGKALKKTIDTLNMHDDLEYSYEEILICSFQCIFIKMCIKNEVFEFESTHDYDAYCQGITKLKEVFDGRLNTNILSGLIFDKIVVVELMNMADVLTNIKDFSVDKLGVLFETFYNMEVDTKSPEVLVERETRKDEGMYFSNKELVKFICEDLSKNYLRSDQATCLDPSMGAGIFLLELLAIIGKKKDKFYIKNVIENRIYGVDKNPLIVDLFVISVWVKYSNLNISIDKLTSHFISEDSLLLAIQGNVTNNWQSKFPEPFQQGGFDYIVGNPPWGRIKANIREYNLFHQNDTAKYQGIHLKNKIEKNKKRFKAWDEYKKYISKYSSLLKQSINFTNQKYGEGKDATGGDADLYKYFLELSFKLLKVDGKIGMIIPASFYLTEGATGLRHLYLENGDFEYFINFENKKKIFDIHPSYKFLLFKYKKTMKPGKIKKAIFNLVDTKNITEKERFRGCKFISYDRQFLDICSPFYWAIPECATEYEKAVLVKLYRKFPLSVMEDNKLWSISFNREIDMTLDSDLFLTKATKKMNLLPVYEGRMVNQYNSSQKFYKSGNGRTAVWEVNSTPESGEIRPHYYVERDKIKNADYARFRASYCDITGQKNVRTILATLISPQAICGNKVPTCTFLPEDKLIYHLYWIGVANSFVLDWIMRKKITITLNFYHWEQIPFPRLADSDVRFCEIALAAAAILEKMNGFRLEETLAEEGINIQTYNEYKEMSIAELRLKIDKIVALMFDLTLEQVAIILSNFPSYDRGKAGVPGDKRTDNGRNISYVTRDYLLYNYQEKDADILTLYSKCDLDMKAFTGEIHKLKERIMFYESNNITPY